MIRILFLAPGTDIKAMSEPERYAYAWACEHPGMAVELVTASIPTVKRGCRSPSLDIVMETIIGDRAIIVVDN